MTKRTHINGVPVEEFGLWCPHGKHVMVVDPNDNREFPDCVMADPWPCNKCTPDQVQAELNAEVAEYDREQWNQYWNAIREGFYL